MICLVKHATEHEENSEDDTFIIRSTSGDIDIPVILLNAEINSNVFIDSGRGKNRKLLCIHAIITLTIDKKKPLLDCTLSLVLIKILLSFEKVK